MNGSPLSVFLFVLLAAIAAGGLAYAFLQPLIASERKTESRLKQLKRAETDTDSKRVARERLQEAAKRRRTIQSSLKEIEAKQKERDKHTTRLSTRRLLDQAGLKMSVRGFVLTSIAVGVAFCLVAFVLSGSLLVALGMAITGGVGLPRWSLGYLRKRRQKQFLNEFANSVDLMVRGIRAGLPLSDCLRIVASDAPEPVRSEFRKIVETQQMGMSTPEAVERLYHDMPLAETNFFAIVLSIQAQAGGNLSEALSNLSRVLRDRKKMKGKIQAMSMEAKASGGIIGSLPVIVGLLVYMTTPDYILVLFDTNVGKLIMGVSVVWMFAGVMVMRKMINFDF
ncbi:type II secretion system F family protein [Consotaella aegiceratis]|uniref:type II secretion system F family protein n=1 Tax=Consotaella aegiceratis TaxID=3097961 RepID=UPI002F405EE2